MDRVVKIEYKVKKKKIYQFIFRNWLFRQDLLLDLLLTEKYVSFGERWI